MNAAENNNNVDHWFVNYLNRKEKTLQTYMQNQSCRAKISRRTKDKPSKLKQGACKKYFAKFKKMLYTLDRYCYGQYIEAPNSIKNILISTSGV